MEPIAMKSVSGLISVSGAYIDTLANRYPHIQNIPTAIIPFGAFGHDLEIANQNKASFSQLLNKNTINIVYIGRGGADMHQAITPVFKSLQDNPQLTAKLKMYFIGTSYAPVDKGVPTIKPLAAKFGVDHCVEEITDRISYYHALATLQQADALFIPGSDDPGYSASKLYSYFLLAKPILAIFNPNSPAMDILREYGCTSAYGYTDTDVLTKTTSFFMSVINGDKETNYNVDAIEKYSAQNLTKQQCALFNSVINHHR